MALLRKLPDLSFYKIPITLFLLFSILILSGQESKKERLPFIRLNFQSGAVLQTNTFLKGENSSGQPIDTYAAGAIELGYQTNGSKRWHHLWGMPKVGVGMYTAEFINSDELGNPAAIYAFFNNELKTWGRFSINFEGAAGLTFNWRPYDYYINPANIAIGSYNTVYLDFGLKAQYLFSKNWQVDLGYTFTHFSNGATSLPNMGINMTGPKVSVAYHIRGNDPNYLPEPESDFEKKNEYFIDLKYSTKQVKFDTNITGLSTEYLGISYDVYGLAAGYLRFPNERWKYGGGFDMNYDRSRSAQLDVVDGEYNTVTVDPKYYYTLSAFATGHMVVGKTSFFVDLGYYLYREEIPGQTPDWYQRFGAKHNIYKGIQVMAMLRAYDFGIADHIEWGVGYKF